MGSTSTTFKNRYSYHKATFHNKLKGHNTVLSNFLCELKDVNKDYNLKWGILCSTELNQNRKTTKHAIYVA